jgi:ATP citrate (pro-S)-lyase
MVLMLTADHGPAVSGAMNTIVATRAGKDLISSLASGLLTIGSRFGGALDEAASMFSNARDVGLTPREFVNESRKANKLSAYRAHFCLRRWCTEIFFYSQRYWPQDQECQQP